MPTIKDIAKKAQVSKSTVSKVINNYPGVKEETKKKVIDVMKKYNYWPNATARSLSTNKSYTIGIFDPSRLNNFFFREVFSGIEDVFGKEGYDLIYFTNKRWGETWVDFSYTEKSKNRNVDGVLLMGFGNVNLSQFDDLVSSNIPAVFVDLDLTGKNSSFVMSNNIQGARKAVKYLYKLGHRKIGIIRGPNGFRPAQERFLGFQEAINELGLEYNPAWIFSDEYKEENGYKLMKKILKLTDRPTAIFSEDVFAIGAIQAVKEAGLSVPEDFSFIGFDNIELSRHYNLTTIAQDKYGMGAAAARLLLKIINGDNFAPVILPTELIVRGTCNYLSKSQD